MHTHIIDPKDYANSALSSSIRYADLVTQLQALYEHEYDSNNWSTLKSCIDIERVLQSVHRVCVVINTAAAGGSKRGVVVTGFGTLAGNPADPLLEDLIVHHSYKRQGIGKQLVHVLLQECWANAECQRVELYCNSKLLPFYSKFDFQVVRQDQGSGRCYLRLLRPADK